MYCPKLRESNLSMFIPGGKNRTDGTQMEKTIQLFVKNHQGKKPYRWDTLELLQSRWTDTKSEAGAVTISWCAGTWVEEYLPNYRLLTFILLFILCRACCMVSCGASCGIEEWREGAETMSLRHSQSSSADSHNKGKLRCNCTDLMLKFSFEQGPLLSLCLNCPYTWL